MTDRTLLVTISGTDRPGVTRAIFTSMASHPVHVTDMEQLVVRGRLILVVLVSIDSHIPDSEAADILHETRTAVRMAASALDLEVSTVPGAAVRTTNLRDKFQVIVMGDPLSAEAISRVSASIAELGGNIDRIHRVAA